MRAGGCTVQQTLTLEAANVVKQAVSLARRRGHAQVTPLHVANTMLFSSPGLLRAACLQSHSHPLQCKALELCFNVALNRLPASSSSSSSILSPHHHHHPPSLSNALVAAFKRAQAHQRRGSIETQQQPMLTVKIELEQLIISILDDPSVSRVMREAGFSSTQVKTNVEQAVETPNPNPSKTKEVKLQAPPERTFNQVRSEDVTSVVDCLASRRKRSVVIVGECLAATEGVVRGVMDRIDKGEVSDHALQNIQFITLPLHSFRVMTRDEVEQKVGELRCLVKSCCVGRGAVLYLGDLQWAVEYRLSGEKGRGYYCPVEHVVMEIRSLLCGGMGIGGERFWVMAIATHQTYMRCRAGNPSLEALWSLQPLAIPAASLELSLNCESDSQSQFKSKQSGVWSVMENGVGNQLTCCADCSVKFEKEVHCLPHISSKSHGSINSTLPSWLQQYKEESKRNTIDDQDSIQHLCKKWNTICQSSHKQHHRQSEMTLHFSSVSPSSSSVSSYAQQDSCLHHAWPVPASTQHPWRDHHPWRFQTATNEPFHFQSLPAPPSTNPNSNPNSASSSETMEMEQRNKFKELNAENLKTLSNSLEREVPWQRDIIPEIASTILQCRSGMMRRKDRSRSAAAKEETWMFFLGGDVHGKEKIARELALLVFSSCSSFISIGLSSFSTTTMSGSTDELPNKRSRSDSSHGFLERFIDALSDNPHRVILLEDIEQIDSYSQACIKAAIERGRIKSSMGEELSLHDAVIILCCESFDSRSRACSPPTKLKSDSDEVNDEREIGSCVHLDLNLSAVDEEMESCSFEDVGLLESVDRTFFFRLPQDL